MMKYGRSYLAILLVSVAVVRCEIILSHESLIKHPDDSFLVTCKDNAGRPVTWSGGRGALGASTRPKVTNKSYGTSIYFDHVNEKDGGNYTCSAGTDKKHFTLIVLAPLTFMDTNPVQTGNESTDVTLRCEVKAGYGGGDKALVTWSVEDGDLSSDPRIQQIGDGLLIKNVTRADSKTYICKAMQTSTGDMKEQRIQLKVEHQPVFRHNVWAQDEEVFGFIGGTVNMTCEVDAEPPPTFEWRFPTKIEQIGRLHNSSHKSVLEIFVRDKTVFDKYICIAKNKLGRLKKIFFLQEGEQPVPPDFIELRGANSNLLDVGIHAAKDETVKTGMETTGYRVEYRPRDSTPWLYTDFQISEDNSYPLRELQHDTEYDVRAATINKAGLSVFTNHSSFRTLTADSDGATNPCSISIAVLILIAAFPNW